MKSLQCLYTGKGYGNEGNACNLIEEALNSVEKACKCWNVGKLANAPPTSWWSPDCQIQEISDEKFTCISNVSSSCLLEVKNWAEAFSRANMTNDPKSMCDDLSLSETNIYMRPYVQEIWESCAPGSQMKYFKMQSYTTYTYSI